MASAGLFTREELKGAVVVRQAPPKARDVPPERLWALGLAGVQNINPEAQTKHMAPAGAEKPLVYVLGEAPGLTESEQGVPFVGKAGQTLRAAIPKRYRDQTRFDNVCRTQPPKNRVPEYHEIECYRPSVMESIETAAPPAILAVGMTPIKWVLGPLGVGAKVLRGRRFPVRIGTHACWLYTTFHPSYINRIRDGRDEEGIPGEELEAVFKRDVVRCYADAAAGLPPPAIADPAPILEASDWYSRGPIADVLAWFTRFAASKTAVGIDIETNAKRPYAANAKLLSFAISGPDRGFAVAVDHPEAIWSKADRANLLAALADFIRSPVPKVAHNLAFEQEWFAHLFGLPAIRAGAWHDTLAGGYIIDERRGGLSLDFLCLQEFGVHLKAYSKLDRANLAAAPAGEVLKYNLLDAAFTARLRRAQRPRLAAAGLADVYAEQVRRVPTVVTAQARGFPVDQVAVRQLLAATNAKKDAAIAALRALPGVIAYEKRYGRFNPLSNNHLPILFRDILRRPEGALPDGRYTTKESVLAQMVGVPEAQAVLAVREQHKLAGTYLAPLDRMSKDTVVWPDGRVHCLFNTTTGGDDKEEGRGGTATRRLSSSDPNLQNLPVRTEEGKRVRAAFNPGPDYVVLKNDYGQIEARVLAMASKDPVFVEALWTDFDIHMAWAEKINAAWPDTCKTRYGGFDKAAMKKFRGDVKADWVFAGFYGAGIATTSRRFNMDERVCRTLFEEFWDEFRGVRAWQLDTVDFYNANHYVETLTGFRRRAPLNYNMQINSSIQGTASDIVVDAMNRLSEAAYAEDDPHLSPVVNVHDDLVLIVPKRRADDYLARVVDTMLDCPFDFVNVPLVVESAVGPHWGACEEVGKFRSDA